MSSEWTQTTLGDVCLKITDGAHASPKSVAFGKPMASVKDMTRFGIDLSSARLISVEDYESLVKQGCRPEIGDVLIAKDGNSALDTVCNVKSSLDAVLLSSVAILRPNPEKIDTDFLKFYLSSSDVVEYLKSTFISGAAIPRVVLRDFKKAEINIPPLSIQKEIATVLNAIEDRIFTLRETNTTLEAIAQALFKSWFVDFDPVHAKMQGLAPEGMDEATAALFPDSFEESELGAVPKGWSISSVADVAEIIKGKSYSSKDLVDQYTTALVTLKSFERGGGFRMDGFKPYSGAFKPSQVVTSGDLIVAYTDVTQAAELIGKPAIVVGIEEHYTLVASLDVGIVRPDFSKCGRQFLYGLFKTDLFQSHTLSHTSGTTVLHLAKDGVGSYRFTLPSASLINVFEQIATKLTERKQTNSDQVRTLASLRDELLPRLISGKLATKGEYAG
jgi:type I restriction enzyme S subunit